MNLAVVFAGILTGAVVIDYGVKSVRAASGSSPASAPVPGGTGSNPLPEAVRWGRTDQGVDASATPGSAVNAIVSGVVTAIVPGWYAGQPAIVVSSPGLPGNADSVYYAEQVTPTVKVGQQVSAGEQIGTVASSGTGLEIGLWKSGRTLAQATTGYVEGQATHAGDLMRSWLQSLGVNIG